MIRERLENAVRAAVAASILGVALAAIVWPDTFAGELLMLMSQAAVLAIFIDVLVSGRRS